MNGRVTYSPEFAAEMEQRKVARALVAWGRAIRVFCGLAPKCEIQWIDAHGEPTPDNDDAIGVATCVRTDPNGSRWLSKPYAICARHAELCANGAQRKHWSWTFERSFAAYRVLTEDEPQWDELKK